MQIHDVVSNAAPYNGTPYYFSAILFEDWEFWTGGPHAHERELLLQKLTQYQKVIEVQIVKTYVPFLS